ncbi:hypothetical protein AVEN_132560-1 [Araneus ventricosus]|uniref:Uncharacterized protein n=1 Tax=Araneus ventricosus TaxID=182803 RepID=A0A4Y2PUE4_ARAVE|nr:hypothetical protein AVEN_132560-1 [Araneus ventricosus]
MNPTLLSVFVVVLVACVDCQLPAFELCGILQKQCKENEYCSRWKCEAYKGKGEVCNQWKKCQHGLDCKKVRDGRRTVSKCVEATASSTTKLETTVSSTVKLETSTPSTLGSTVMPTDVTETSKQ